MNAVILSQDQFDEFIERLESIEEKMCNPSSSEEMLISNADFIDMMGICNKTASNWRKENKIGYRKIGKGIYYSMDGIQQFIEAHGKGAAHPIFKKNGKKK